ncbi:MAG: hypothetical protein EAZ60_04020 [Oscillatoriales cyanobacterium]|nr:MAG: hypothetical protein EAZ79_20860 [Oscillatoriales cyanobacterium]TAF38197.1 MAG: hypothetical protein EAZ69_04810 [Oscillatoriales cyanobacterium]TAF58241.1 MAG: hypothetical protein EAZ60_04020 [Oscillatoriales cyanobacterium]
MTTPCQADFLTRLVRLAGLHLFGIKNEPRRREEAKEEKRREERYIYEYLVKSYLMVIISESFQDSLAFLFLRVLCVFAVGYIYAASGFN